MSSVWQKYQVAFDDLDGGVALFEDTEVLAVHFKTEGNVDGDFELWIDDPAFC